MRRRWTFVLLGMMVLGLFASPLTFTTPARGAQQEGSFSAAAVLLAQGGDMSQYKYSLQEPPGWPPVKCEFNAAGSQVKVSGGGNVILAYRKYATQKVTVQTSLLQRLANGQYETLQTSGTLQTILTTDDPVEAA